jgi:hypothetical protein
MRSKLLTNVVFFRVIFGSVELALLKPVCWVLCVALVFRLILLFLLDLAVKARGFSANGNLFQAKKGRLSICDRNLMFYECVRLIVFVVAVQRDPIYKKEHSQKLRRPIWALKDVLFDNETISLDTFTNSKQQLPHLGLQNVNLWLKFSLLAKD